MSGFVFPRVLDAHADTIIGMIIRGGVRSVIPECIFHPFANKYTATKLNLEIDINEDRLNMELAIYEDTNSVYTVLSIKYNELAFSQQSQNDLCCAMSLEHKFDEDFRSFATLRFNPIYLAIKFRYTLSHPLKYITYNSLHKFYVMLKPMDGYYFGARLPICNSGFPLLLNSKRRIDIELSGKSPSLRGDPKHIIEIFTKLLNRGYGDEFEEIYLGIQSGVLRKNGRSSLSSV